MGSAVFCDDDDDDDDDDVDAGPAGSGLRPARLRLPEARRQHGARRSHGTGRTFQRSHRSRT